MARKRDGSHTDARQGEPWLPDPPRAARAAGRAPALPRERSRSGMQSVASPPRSLPQARPQCDLLAKSVKPSIPGGGEEGPPGHDWILQNRALRVFRVPNSDYPYQRSHFSAISVIHTALSFAPVKVLAPVMRGEH